MPIDNGAEFEKNFAYVLFLKGFTMLSAIFVVSVVLSGGPGDDGKFIRGDANMDLTVDLSDVIAICRHIMHWGDEVWCPDAGDANNDGNLNFPDVWFLLDYMFNGGQRPPMPFPERGPDIDEEPDQLLC